MSNDLDRRLDALARDDKWFLSCGDGTLWAPPHPVWLDRPGFWDEALVYQFPFAPLFSVAFVDDDGHEVPLKLGGRRWWPDRLEVDWRLGRARLRERRVALPGGTFASRWSAVEGDSAWIETLSLVAFTMQPGPDVEGAGPVGTTGIQWTRSLVDRRGQRLDVEAALSVTGDAAAMPAQPRLAAVRAEGDVAQPAWRHTPFAERWPLEGGLGGRVRLDGISTRGLVHLAVSVPLRDTRREGATVSIALRPLWQSREPRQTPASHATLGPRREDAREAWRAFLAGFPTFRCSDPYLERYYDYRLYGLRLNQLAGGAPNIPAPAVAEGIGDFHVPITYSAQCHMLEMRWARTPEVAQGSLINFLASQRPDGALHGRLYRELEGTDFYHANWGDACLAVDVVHPDPTFLARACDGLSRYARWLDATRDREGSGLYDVVDQYETGQEYMSRYLAVDPDADRYGWENRIRLKGVDVAVYTYQLKRALATMCGRLGRWADERDWNAGADTIGRAIVDWMWDPRTGLFSDVDPRSMVPTGVKAAVCFYPLLTDLVDEPMLGRLLEHLGNPAEFATPFPAPSSSVDDAEFNAYAEWRGKRHLCPWNGRVWPMTNSHLVEGLLRQWHRGRRSAGPPAALLLGRFVRMMFHDGDLGRPNCYEHYNPFTGAASVYRGIDDYMHSWVVDLLIRGVAGIEPTPAGLRVDPLPLDLDSAALEGFVIRGRQVSVHRQGEVVRVDLAGARHETRVGDAMEIPW